MSELTVYEIPEMNYPDLEAKLAKLNKKAVKLNCEPITLTQVGTIDHKITVPWTTNKVLVRHIQCTITGIAPIIAGWELIASCEQKENGTLIRAIPEKPYPERYRKLMICEHCNSDRYRKYTFIVRNIETNEFKMVGKSCLKDFLGHKNPQFLAYMLQWIADFDQSEYDNIPHGYKSRIKTENYLTFVAACIREEGWTSKTTAYETGIYPTSSSAFEAMDHFGEVHRDYKGNIIYHPEPTEQDKELANKALNWAKNLTDLTNDYLYNINLLSQETSITHKDLGFVASIVSSYTKHIEREIIKEQKSTAKKKELISDYVGTIGEKIQTELTFMNCFTYETQWGTTDILKFMDIEGNIFIWKTSTNQELEQGQKVKIKGRIKDHSEYRGAKQTILTRCKIA